MNRHFLKLAGILLLALAVQAQNPPTPPPPARPLHPVRAHRLADDSSRGPAYLGVDVSNIDSQRAGELKLKEARGVEIQMLDHDSPAWKGGLREHDVIQSFDGKPVGDRSDLEQFMHESSAGKTVAIGYVRNGQAATANVTLASRDYMSFNDMRIEIPPIHIAMPTMPEIPVMVMTQSYRRSGVQVENLNAQLRDFFGVKSGVGVLVRGVDKGSRAEQAGLRAGDVIVRVADQQVRGTDDFMHAMRVARGTTVQLGIVRDRREQSLSLNIPASGPGDGSEMRGLDIEIPAGELGANMQEWAQQFSADMKRNAEQWKREWRSQQKEWEKQQKAWEKEQHDRQEPQ